RIEDYALIGDCHSAGLVGRDGSLDWLCWPRFDSAACFAALLGKREHGRWRIAPVGVNTCASRSYRGDSLILETEFETADGALTHSASHRDIPGPTDAERALKATEKGWKEWCEQCTVKGEWAPFVRRSLITLKALTYAPTGGLVAAPTTSLPEQLGGVRNWDYR